MSAEKGRGAAGYVVSLADRRSIVTVAAAVGSVAGVVAVVVWLWREVGDVQIGTAGWVAMALGVLVTLALGIGLMALVFISSRRGYDELAAIPVGAPATEVNRVGDQSERAPQTDTATWTEGIRRHHHRGH